MENFFTPDEIADQLKVHLQTILNYIKDGRLKAIKLDKGYRISQSDFDQFTNSSKTVKTPEDYFLQLGYQKKYKAFRKTSMKPVVPLTNSIPNQDLGSLLENSSVKNREGYRAFPFPSLSLTEENQKRLSDGILFEKETSFAGDLFFFTFSSNKGEILSAESLWEDAESSRFPNSIGLLTSIGIIYRGLLFIPRYYSSIQYNGLINYAFIIDKPVGRNLAMDSEKNRTWTGKYIATTEDPIIIERKVNTSITTEEAKSTTIKMVEELLWYFKCGLEETIIKELVDEIASNVVIK